MPQQFKVDPVCPKRKPSLDIQPIWPRPPPQLIPPHSTHPPQAQLSLPFYFTSQISAPQGITCPRISININPSCFHGVVFYIIQSKIMKASSLKSCLYRPHHIFTTQSRPALPSIAISANKTTQCIHPPSGNTTKKNQLCVQEVSLDNHKWLVFNEEADQETAERMWALASFRRKAKPIKTHQRLKKDLSRKQNVRIFTDFEDKRQTATKLDSPSPKMQESCLKNTQRSQKLRASRKVTLATKEECSVRESISHSNRPKNMSKSNKSNRSIKSVGSNRTRSPSKSHRKAPKASNVSLAQQKMQEKSQQNGANRLSIADNIDTNKQDVDKRLLIAAIYDPIELLNPCLLAGTLCHDFYEDFPEWKFTDLPKASYAQQFQPQVQSAPEQIEPVLSPELNVCIDSTVSRSIEVFPSRSSTMQQEAPQPQMQLIIQPHPQTIQEVEQTPLNQQQQPQLQQKQVLPQDNLILIKQAKLNQCLPTNYSEIHEKTQSQLNAEIEIVSQRPNGPQLFEQIKEQSIREPSFDQMDQLSQFKQVRMILIDPNEQTALLPSKFTNQFLCPIPSISSLHCTFRNDTLLSFLNHLIFTQPHVIQNAFQVPNKKAFCCKLYDEGQRKRVLVDGLFPFDANYYPLFGSFDQFIWFSVLTKCIAKLKGSYSAINSITESDIYFLLTGTPLCAFDFRANQYNALKQMKLLVKASQQVKSTLLVARKSSLFYKVLKIQTIKPVPKIKQIYQKTKPSNPTYEDNFKSLNHFLKKEIIVYEKNELHENTAIYLKSFNSRRRLTFRDFVEQGFEVLVSADITQSGQYAA